MATRVYDITTIHTIDGEEIEASPLKIKYLRQFMDAFVEIKNAKDEDSQLLVLCQCCAIAMKQYKPEIATVAGIEDNFDVKTIYKIMDAAGGIKMENTPEKEIEAGEPPLKAKDIPPGEKGSWDSLKLAQLEAEVFTLGIWKDFDDLERSLSMQELTAILEEKREQDYQHKKFLAAMQGVDLDAQTGKANSNAWEDLKARVVSKGKARDGNDILALQGVNAQKAGFGIGMGLDYEVHD